MNILLTGATGGIGSVIADTFKENNLFLTGKRKLEIKNYYSCNLADINSIQNLFSSAMDFFNQKIDVLINCAGGYIEKQIEDMTIDEINYLIDLNFKSSYFLSSLVIPCMKKNKWGRIINIGSISGVIGESYATLYSATKSALSGLTKSLALEVAQYNITVNQINPGWVETKLIDGVDKQEIIDTTPQKRFIEPFEIADLCKYLVSNSAKGITGQNINLCAGLTIGC